MVEITSDINLHGLTVSQTPDAPLTVPGGIAVRSEASLCDCWLQAEDRLKRGIGKRLATIYIGDLMARKRVVYFVPPEWWNVVEAMDLCFDTEADMVEVEPQWGSTRGGTDRGYKLKLKRMLRLRVEIDGPFDSDGVAVLVEEIVKARGDPAVRERLAARMANTK